MPPTAAECAALLLALASDSTAAASLAASQLGTTAYPCVASLERASAGSAVLNGGWWRPMLVAACAGMSHASMQA